ncbi:translocation/assembly module TamB domain-containing protein [Chitinophaga parva]|nr:translocation/assembly module TamB domain-containing protein [Chitinophaga parva]
MALLVMVAILINLSPVQNFLVKQATDRLSTRLKTKVQIRNVDFSLFNRMKLEGVLLEDRNHDTLIYAGSLNVRITDWFFFQHRPVIKYVGMDDALIYLHRTPKEKNWNYQFLLDAFANPNPDTSTTGGVDLDFKTLNLRNIRINQIDEWAGENWNIAAARIYADARDLDLAKHHLDLQQVLLDKFSFIITDYPASPLRRHDTIPPQHVLNDTTIKPAHPTLRWNEANWSVVLKSLQVNDGLFGLDNLEDSSEILHNYFAPNHIRFHSINLSLTNGEVVKDSILADLKLETRERSGFEVKKLTCRWKMSPTEMEFKHLDLQTNRSRIRDYYTMQYNSLDDMSYYVDSVIMKATFRDAHIHSDDIAYFAPVLGSWKKEFRVNGDVHGPVANLSGKNLDIESGPTHLKASVELRGLPEVDESFIDAQVSQLTTNGTDIMNYAPDLKGVDNLRLERITSLAFTGSYTGFFNDFVAYGKFNTNLGNFNSDINFKTAGDVPLYSGNISTDNFNLGALLDIPNLDAVTMDAKVNGNGFNFNTLKSTVEADIQSITLFDYTYHDLSTKGELNRKFFNGSVTVHDPNLDMDFAGTIDFNGKLPLFNFNSDIRKSDLKALHLTQDSITLQAHVALDFAGGNIDDFEGTARVYDVSLFKNKTRVEFDSLSVRTSRDSNNVKMLSMKGNEVNGFIKGNYSLRQLPQTFQMLLYKYYPNFFLEPEITEIHQDFNFAFEFGQVEKLIRAFDSHIHGFNGTTIAGTLNTENSGNVKLEVMVPSASYDNYGVKELHLRSAGDLNHINVSTSMGEVLNKDQVLFQHPLILVNSRQDTSYLKVDLNATDSSNMDGFYAKVITTQGGAHINFLNSNFTYNDRQWNITPGNEIYWSKHFLTIKNLRISRNDQNITISTNEYNPDDARVTINVENLNLADAIPVEALHTRFEGVANGSLEISELSSNLDGDANLTVQQFRVDNDSIGKLDLQAHYDHDQESLGVDVHSDNPLRNFAIHGTAGLTALHNKMQGSIDLNGTSLALLEPYVSDYVTDLSGVANGQLRVGGTTDQPSVTGQVTVDSIGVKVPYIGTRYRIPHLNINLDDNLIEFGKFTLVDKNNNTAQGNGYISHDHFHKLNFDFDISTNKFVFLNTKADDNDLYYGDVIASGKVYFSGPINDLQLRVVNRPMTGTHIFLPMSDSKNIGKYDFITFREYGHTVKPPRHQDNVKLNVRLEVAANPDAQVDVILDASTGDVISANGSGQLAITANLDGDFKIEGNYLINNGSYNFTFQRLASWKFDIEKNSTLTWNGDPEAAKMNITARYSLPKVSLYNLSVPGTAGTDKLATRTEKVDIVLTLHGELMQPDIGYQILLPDVGSVSYESGVAAKLAEINRDQNKALLQMYGLLLANQFIPEESGTGVASAVNVGVTGKNSVGQALSAQASAILNNITANLTKSNGFNLNLNYRAYNVTNVDNSNNDRNEVSAGISSNLFNNRFRLYLGGDYDWGKTATAAQSNRFAGDFRFEYLLTADGRFRVNAFSKSDYDVYYLANRTKAGLGLSYIREYNRFRELFYNRRQLREQDSIRVLKEKQRFLADTSANVKKAPN